MKVWRCAARRESLPNCRTRSQNHPTQKDVKNEGSSSEFIENKGAKKVLLRVDREQRSSRIFTMSL
jgi:hypothetical protein